jgi:rhodanese-related sulfurtransferase
MSDHQHQNPNPRSAAEPLSVDPEWEIHPKDVKNLMQEGNIVLIDVRTLGEWETARIHGAIHMPLADLPGRLHEIHPHRSKPIIVHCHHGMRSLRAVKWLRDQGFKHARSMATGIDGWSRLVDPAVPRY